MPGIHDFAFDSKADGRDKPGHDKLGDDGSQMTAAPLVHRCGPAMQLSRTQTTLLVTGIIVAAAIAEYLMGHPLICKCGYVKLWHFDVQSAENSQHLIDWYTPSHIIHGFLFYWLLWLLSRWMPLSFGVRLVLAVAIEASWEVVENTDFVINHYREMTISLDYYGDSVINSVSDILFMVLGFFVAAYLPVWLTVLIAHRARAVRRRHDQGQSDAERADVRLAARLPCCNGSRAGERSEIHVDPEHHIENEPEIDGDGRIEGDAEAEGAHIGIVVIADPEQHASHQE